MPGRGPRTCTLAALAGGLLLAVSHAAAESLAGPSAPSVVGPRKPAQAAVTYRFSSREPGVPQARLRFVCSFDSVRLHPCARVLHARLAAGAHVLRVAAVDPSARRSRVTRVAIVVTLPAPVPRATAFRVGPRP